MNPYSLHDIEQYLRGELPPAEMHAIEKAALQDPFLADAIEGYRSAGIITAIADLSSIHEQLHTTKEVTVATGKVVAIKNIAWLQVAASVILVAGATTLGVVLLKKETKENKQIQTVATSKKKDTIAKDMVAALTEKESVKAQSVLTDPPTVMAASPRIKGYDTIIKRVVEYQVKPVAGSKNMTPFTVTATINETVRTSPDQVAKIKMDSTSTAVISYKPSLDAQSSAPIKELLKQLPGIQVDKSGNITSYGQPVQKVLVDRDEFFGDHFRARQLGEVRDTIDTRSQLNDLVVVGYGTSRKKEIPKAIIPLSRNTSNIYFPPAISSHIARSARSKDELGISPENGWPEFNRYLSEKLSLVQSDLKTAYDSLAVKLTIDKTGKVINTDIERSFNLSLNDKLIKAITEGPTWINLVEKPRSFSLIITVYR